MAFDQWLGTSGLPHNTKNVLALNVLINSIRTFADNLLLIVLVLFLLDRLDPVAVGLAWSIFFGIQALVDFPTGNLGDTIGHKNVLLIAYLLQIFSFPFLLLSDAQLPFFAITETIGIFLFMFFYGLGISQESGALEAWTDNIYRKDNIDPQRAIYSQFIAKSELIIKLATMMGFLMGGFVSTLISPFVVFWIVLILRVFTFLIIAWKMDSDDSSKYARKISSYVGKAQKSILAFLRSPIMLTYFLGIATLWAANEAIWYTFILFRIYREYGGGTDAGAGIIRSIVFLFGILWQLVTIKIIHRFKHAAFWVFIASLLSNALFFALLMLYYRAFPPTTFSLLLLAGLLLIYQIPIFWENIQYVLQQRINLDLVPDEYRNSLYSLLPTLTRLLGVPFVYLTGVLIEQYGFYVSFYWLIAVSIAGSSLLALSLLLSKRTL